MGFLGFLVLHFILLSWLVAMKVRWENETEKSVNRLR